MQLLTIKEARLYLRVSESTLRRTALRDLRPVRIGSRVLLDRADLDKWLSIEKRVDPELGRGGRKPKSSPTIRRHQSGIYYARFTFRRRRFDISTGTRDEAEAVAQAEKLYRRVTRPPTTSGPGVYLIRCRDRAKIGRSRRSIEQRFRAIVNGLPDSAVLVGALSEDPEDERLFHELFAPLRVKGEWFSEPDLIENTLRRMGCLP